MNQSSHSKFVRARKRVVACCVLALFAGCTEKPKPVAARYPVLAPREVPPYLKDSILEYTDLGGVEPFPVSGYGLVVHLRGTGGTRVPTPVRDYISKMLEQHNYFTLQHGWASPEALLASKDVSIVRIDGLIPPGARSALGHQVDPLAADLEHQHAPTDARSFFDNSTPSSNQDWCTWFDVQVSAMPGSDASSLAHGDLYQADLKINGANPSDPGNGMITVKAQAAGAIFVNPNYLLEPSNNNNAAARDSLKSGVILAGARAMEDRPILLRLRSPSYRAARAIEQRIIDRFQDVVDDDLRPAVGNDAVSSKKVANANDEGLIYVYVPRVYNGDWEHFVGVVRHLYMNGADPQFAALKSRELADAAVKPNAPLQDISYCWEGLGKPALFAMLPLMESSDPQVQFAAARAAAFLGDPGAVPVLLSIASSRGNPFRVTAVLTLAALPPTPKVDHLCRTLLDSDEASVREAAYELLAKHQDSAVATRFINNDSPDGFALDLVQSNGPPLVYATQRGIPRIAIFGTETELELPIMYSAMDHRLTISSDAPDSNVTIFYRGSELMKPISVTTTASLPEIVGKLAGDGDEGRRGLRFHYADIVAIVGELIDQQRVSGLSGQKRLLAAFVLQQPGKVVESVNARPLVRDGGSRPQSDNPGVGDKSDKDHLLRDGSKGPQASATGDRPSN